MKIIGILGIISLFVGWAWLLPLAFRQSRLLGYICFFIPILCPALALADWEAAKKPFALMLTGLAMLFMSVHLS
jgi:hypothetical protein